ncbi:hypothetical protein CBR_g12371 [Chara braunii]|uniref:RNA helicase n=1 Tax=Chara braunii TaxID=69332 RepID=A0A388KS91_CHABU|nr:hypothetical protein CBR_g12371 [Chara braunii]|eukprot:GBG72803.1 hypothetical protein CBR_g12371 [Chara braunii]
MAQESTPGMKKKKARKQKDTGEVEQTAMAANGNQTAMEGNGHDGEIVEMEVIAKGARSSKGRGISEGGGGETAMAIKKDEGGYGVTVEDGSKGEEKKKKKKEKKKNKRKEKDENEEDGQEEEEEEEEDKGMKEDGDGSRGKRARATDLTKEENDRGRQDGEETKREKKERKREERKRSKTHTKNRGEDEEEGAAMAAMEDVSMTDQREDGDQESTLLVNGAKKRKDGERGEKNETANGVAANGEAANGEGDNGEEYKKGKKEKKKKRKKAKEEDLQEKNEENEEEEEEEEEGGGYAGKRGGGGKLAVKVTAELARSNGKSNSNSNSNSKAKASLEDAEKLRKELGLTLTGSGAEQFPPIRTFRESGLPDDVIATCRSFEKPSPIQSQSWPVVLAGRDLIGIAATGSGKTIAFAVPALMHLQKTKKTTTMMSSKTWKKTTPSPTCLVLSPTRELAQQISGVFEEAGAPLGVLTVCVYGGVPKGPQRDMLRKGATVVVATPGRLMDLMEEGACSLQHVDYLVLDEADRMLDLGFEAAIRAIIKTTSSSRQTLMFSATWPQAVGQLASEFLNNPLKITVGSEDLAANHSVTQIVEVLEDRARDARLDELLRKYHKSRKNRILVFVLYKKEAVRVEMMLQRRGWNVVAVHGDKGQTDRTNAVNSFKDGSVPLLIATDVAARGLDIPDVEYVINYSFPLTTEDYVHRIGRTGRAGKKGVSHTFFTMSDKLRAGELMNVLREAGQEIPEALMKFGAHTKKKESKLYGAHFREISADAPKAQKIVFNDDDE